MAIVVVLKYSEDVRVNYIVVIPGGSPIVAEVTDVRNKVGGSGMTVFRILEPRADAG